MEENKIVKIEKLNKWFEIKKGLFNKKKTYVKAVNNVSFDVSKGETLSIVGESGCGKSTLCRTIIRLYEPLDGSIEIEGEEISHLSNKQMMKHRQRMQMVFQDPYSSLDPRMTIGDIIAEPLKIEGKLNDLEIMRRVVDTMGNCGIDVEHISRYPHEFSGGQRQRVGIARALSVLPKILICDEPVSALDVSIQSQIINLLKKLQKELDLTVLFVSHDLSVVNHISDRVMVMYLGKVMEIGSIDDIYENTTHPYTQVLLSALPSFERKMLESDMVEGDIPSLMNPPKGCVFHTRCEHCMDICTEVEPELKKRSETHYCACHLEQEG